MVNASVFMAQVEGPVLVDISVADQHAELRMLRLRPPPIWRR